MSKKQENELPSFRISILTINKRNPYPQSMQYQEEYSKLLDSGDYEIKVGSVLDDPENFQVILILQKRKYVN